MTTITRQAPVAAYERRSLTIRIPGCPAPELSPNAKRTMGRRGPRTLHWGDKAEAIASARWEADECMKSALRTTDGDTWDAMMSGGPMMVDAVIAWGYGRKRMDPTNLPAVLKATCDGIADALGVDDKHFRWGAVVQVRAPKDDRAGYVEVVLTALGDEA